MIAAGLLTVMAGCASTVPSSSLGAPEPPCDVICRLMRLFDFDPPTPTSDAAVQHLPVVHPKARHPQRAKAARQARLARKDGAPPSPARPVLPAEYPDLRSSAVEPADTGRPAPMSADPPFSPEHAVAVIPGSPVITPPWFEPLSPIPLRGGSDDDPASTP